MTLDVQTLFLLTMYIEAILGLLLLLVWSQNFPSRAVGWWGAAHLLRSASVALYGQYGAMPNLVSIDLASALLFVSYGVTWNGARVFNGREPLPGSLITGAALWILLCQTSGFVEASALRTLVSGGIVATFSWLAAYEFWRGRSEHLVSRWPAIVLLFVHGSLFLLRTPLNAFLPAALQDKAFSSAWLSVISVESLLFTISVAFVLVAMAKERTELGHRNAARIDALTGLANRRAFFHDAEELVRLQIARGRPVAVFVLDLDHFKSINDRFGHSMGDRVLRLFGQVMMANLRSSDLIGRLGGEEFGVLLADANRDNAFVVAERLRTAFAATAKMGEDPPLAATVSIGVAIIQDPREDLSSLLAKADHALYQAKALGRNRVELAPLDILGATGKPAAAGADGADRAAPLARAMA
jgi:diguanylate cyclase (GGDEF)-like protein